MIPLISASSLGHFTETIVVSPIEATNTQGPPLLLMTHPPSYIRCLHNATWLNFFKIVDLPDNGTISILGTFVEGYKLYPRKPESSGVGSIYGTSMPIFTHLNVIAYFGFMIHLIITNTLCI